MQFCTVQDIEDFLQIEVDEPAAMRAIVEATAAIKNYCRQVLELVEDDEVTLDVWNPRYNLLLPQLPVVSVASVYEDGELLVVDDDYTLAQSGQLLRQGGYRWTTGAGMVVVIYTHGYEEIPDDIVAVCTRAASRAYQAGLKAADAAGVPGIAALSLGDYSVTFSAEGGGGIGEGVLGASAARMLLLSEKDVLNAYRLNP